MPAVRLLLNGDNVTVFPYARSSDADREAAGISSDGSSIGTSNIFWIGPPRFYKRDKLIVLYVGTNPTVIRPLEAVLGTRIAGRG